MGGQIETGVLMVTHLYAMQLWVPSSQEPRAEPEATQSVTGVVLPPGVGIAVSWSDLPCDFCFFQIASPSSSTATMCQSRSLHQSSLRYVSHPWLPVKGSPAELSSTPRLAQRTPIPTQDPHNHKSVGITVMSVSGKGALWTW